MKVFKFLIPAIVVTFGISACHQTQNKGIEDVLDSTSSEKATAQNPLNAEETEFVRNFIQMSLADTKLSEQMRDRTSNQRVKNFISMVITDQESAYQELALLTQYQNSNIQDSLLDINQPDSGFVMKDNYDQAYMAAMEKDYQSIVNSLNEISAKAESPHLKTWIGNTLPRMQRNLDSAVAIHRQLK